MIDLYETCLAIARITGKEYGYAIGLHGTAMRDLDLIAVPWTETACSAEDLVKTLARRIEGETKRGILVEGQPVLEQWPKPMLKPHGRIAYTILLGGPFWIDISVMPRIFCERCRLISKLGDLDHLAECEPHVCGRENAVPSCIANDQE